MTAQHTPDGPQQPAEATTAPDPIRDQGAGPRGAQRSTEGLAAIKPEPVVVTVKRYRCPFCSRGWSQRARAGPHIARCWNNPDVRACKTCVHHQPYEPSRSVCQPGALCACDEVDEACLVGVDISLGLRVDCPKWEARGDA